MLEATRTAMLVTIAFSLVYLQLLPLIDPTEQISWRRGLTVIVLAAISALGFWTCEERAWDNNWANIHRIYDILHDRTDPVMAIQRRQRRHRTKPWR